MRIVPDNGTTGRKGSRVQSMLNKSFRLNDRPSNRWTNRRLRNLELLRLLATALQAIISGLVSIDASKVPSLTIAQALNRR